MKPCTAYLSVLQKDGHTAAVGLRAHCTVAPIVVRAHMLRVHILIIGTFTANCASKQPLTVPIEWQSEKSLSLRHLRFMNTCV